MVTCARKSSTPRRQSRADRACLEVTGSEGMHRVAAPVSISPGQGIWPGEMTLRHLQLPPDSARHREHGDDDDLAGKPWAAPLGDPGGSWSPSAAVSPVSAPSLQRQSETSNVFLEFFGSVSRVASWSFPTSHARALPCIARDPGARLRDVAVNLGIPNAAPTASSPTWPQRLRRHAEKTATATATRSRRTSRYQNPPARNPPSATSWPSFPAPARDSS